MANKRMGPELLALVADRFKALSDRARLSLLQEMRGGALTVNELAAATEMGQATFPGISPCSFQMDSSPESGTVRLFATSLPIAMC